MLRLDNLANKLVRIFVAAVLKIIQVYLNLDIYMIFTMFYT